MSEEAAHEVVERGYDQVTQAYAGLELEGQEWPRVRKLREHEDEEPAESKAL